MSRGVPRVFAAWALAAAVGAAGEAGEKVALRAADGRFLRAARDGTLRPERFLPGAEEIFELESLDKGGVRLKASNGRVLTSPRDKILEIFRVGEIPAAVCKTLSDVVRGIVVEELRGKPYDKVRSRKVERFVDLPAPTLRDPRRTKTHRVLSMIEEYHVRAELDGQPEIEIARMRTLKGYRDPSVSLLMFSVKARVPAQGRLGYKIPGAVSASAGFRAAARLALVGEVRVVKADDRLSLSSPELREVHVELDGLKISNDLLNLAREPIEDLVNHELRRNEARIRQQANKSLAEAVKSREFHNPLLRFLSLP